MREAESSGMMPSADETQELGVLTPEQLNMLGATSKEKDLGHAVLDG